MSVEKPRTIEEQQVANAVERLKGEFAGSSAITEEDVKKAVSQASGETAPQGVAQPIAQEHTLHGFGRIRTDEEGKPLPEDLTPSVRVIESIKAQDDEIAEMGLTPDELARLEAERQFRRGERVSLREILTYSPEQVKILFLEKMMDSMELLQEYQRSPQGFSWRSEDEVGRLRKVIRSLEEMTVLSPEERAIRGYPEFRAEDLVRMGDSSLRDISGIDEMLAQYRILDRAASMGVLTEERDKKKLEAIGELLRTKASQTRVDLGEGSDFGPLGREIEKRKNESFLRIAKKYEKELREVERAILGFNHIFEFYGNVQRILAPSVGEYTKIMSNAFGPKSRFEIVPVMGADYEGLFNAPSLYPGTPPFGDLIDVAFRAYLKDVFRGPNEPETIKNPFSRPPSQELRRGVLDYLKDRVFDYVDKDGRGLKKDNEFQRGIAEAAVRTAWMLIHHWDIFQSAICRVDDSGRVSLETTYADHFKLQFPAARAIGEWRDYNAIFGNTSFTAAMPALTDNFLKINTLVLQGEGGVRQRISLLDLLTKHGFRLKDIPWTGEEEIDLTDGSEDLPEEARRSLTEVCYRGQWVDWKRLTDAREDSLNVPYFLHLTYAGKFYEFLTAEKFDELLTNAITTSFWEGFNKEFEVGFSIRFGGVELDEETIFKMKLLMKLNFVASIMAAVIDEGRVSKKELVRIRTKIGGAQTANINDEVIFDVIFRSGFLQEGYGEIVVGRRTPFESKSRIGIDNTKALINRIRRQKRGAVPGDGVLRDLFTDEELVQIEETGLYKPYLLRNENSPLNIVTALNKAIAEPTSRP